MTGQRVASFVVTLLLMSAGANAQSPDASAASPTAPRLRNAGDLVDELTEQYPLRLRNAAIGGRARVRLRVKEGDVDSTWVAFSSGLPGLDRAALTTVKEAKFEPGTVNGEATPMWTELPLTFRTGEERGPEPQAIPVINRAELEAALPAMMPETMREARIGARVGLDVTVDAAGNPTDFAILETSCLSDSDIRALEIASRLAFAPSSSSAPRRTYASVFFGKDSVSIRLLGDANPPKPRTESDSATTDEEPVRGRAQAPVLRNRAGIARALEERYPPDCATRASAAKRCCGSSSTKRATPRFVRSRRPAVNAAWTRPHYWSASSSVSGLQSMGMAARSLSGSRSRSRSARDE